MTGKTHQVIGQALGVGLLVGLADGHYHPATGAATIVACSISSLLPDIDTPAAKIWQYLPFGLGKVGGHLVKPFLRHRNITHSLVGAALVGEALWQVGLRAPTYWGINVSFVWFVAMAAYLSHLLADALTVEGIPLLFPWSHSFGFPPHPFQSLRIETGKWFENFVVYPLVVCTLVTEILWNWPVIRTVFLL